MPRPPTFRGPFRGPFREPFRGQGSLRLAAVAALSAALIAGPAGAETLTYGTHQPPTHGSMTGGIVPYIDAVKARTGGGLEIEVIGGGAVVSSKTALGGIGSGLVGSGFVIDSYIPQSLPHSNLSTDLGVFHEVPLAATGAVSEFQLLRCPGCVADMAAAGVVSLGVQSLSPYVLMCKDPVTAVDDLKGRKTKTSGPWGPMMAGLGAVPVNLPVTDLYEALQRGTIDCVLGPEGWLKSFALWDSARYVIDQPLGTWAGGHVMTVARDVWEDLPGEHRQAMLDGMPQLLVAMTLAYDEEAAVARKEAAERGLTYLPPVPGLAEAFEKARQTVVADVVAKAAGRGVEEAPALAATFQEVRRKWERIYAESGGDLEVYKRALKTEIYDTLAARTH